MLSKEQSIDHIEPKQNLQNINLGKSSHISLKVKNTQSCKKCSWFHYHTSYTILDMQYITKIRYQNFHKSQLGKFSNICHLADNKILHTSSRILSIEVTILYLYTWHIEYQIDKEHKTNDTNDKVLTTHLLLRRN